MLDSQDTPVSPRTSKIIKQIRSTLKTLIYLLLLIAVAILLNAAIFRFFGGVQSWQSWRADHYWQLLGWRLTLYTGLVVAWQKLKTRLPKDETGQTGKRLFRLEILVVLLVLLVEFSKLALQQGETL